MTEMFKRQEKLTDKCVDSRKKNLMMIVISSVRKFQLWPPGGHSVLKLCRIPLFKVKILLL
jgi:hypothetical protein